MVAVPDRPAIPWRTVDLIVLYAANVIGAVLLLAAWLAASGSVSPDGQVPWLNLALAGIIVAGSGNVVWLLAGRRRVGTLRRSLLPALLDAVAGPPEQAAGSADGSLVATADMTRYHDPACLLVADKPVVPAAEAEHRADGRRPCDVCLVERAGGR